MMAIVRSRTSWLPPYTYKHCQVIAEGIYANNVNNREELFSLMIDTLLQKLGRSILYIEVSHLTQKMFAYRQFRQRGFFPVKWLNITNSLHSRNPRERLDRRTQTRINKAIQRGTKTSEVTTTDELNAFHNLLRKHNMLKPRHYIPPRQFFEAADRQPYDSLLLTTYNNRAIGCSMTVFSQQDAYFWYAAYRRKSFHFLYPQLLTIWHALLDAHRRGYRHFTFIDVGLPYRHSSLRELILRFGGKPQSTFRWFRFRIWWLNRLMAYIYRD